MSRGLSSLHRRQCLRFGVAGALVGLLPAARAGAQIEEPLIDSVPANMVIAPIVPTRMK